MARVWTEGGRRTPHACRGRTSRGSRRRARPLIFVSQGLPGGWFRFGGKRVRVTSRIRETGMWRRFGRFAAAFSSTGSPQTNGAPPPRAFRGSPARLRPGARPSGDRRGITMKDGHECCRPSVTMNVLIRDSTFGSQPGARNREVIASMRPYKFPAGEVGCSLVGRARTSISPAMRSRGRAVVSYV